MEVRSSTAACTLIPTGWWWSLLLTCMWLRHMSLIVMYRILSVTDRLVFSKASMHAVVRGSFSLTAALGVSVRILCQISVTPVHSIWTCRMHMATCCNELEQVVVRHHNTTKLAIALLEWSAALWHPVFNPKFSLQPVHTPCDAGYVHFPLRQY